MPYFYVNSIMLTLATPDENAFIIFDDFSRCRVYSCPLTLNVAFARKLAKATRWVNIIYCLVYFVQLHNSNFIMFLFSRLSTSDAEQPTCPAADHDGNKRYAHCLKLSPKEQRCHGDKKQEIPCSIHNGSLYRHSFRLRGSCPRTPYGR